MNFGDFERTRIKADASTYMFNYSLLCYHKQIILSYTLLYLFANIRNVFEIKKFSATFFKNNRIILVRKVLMCFESATGLHGVCLRVSKSSQRGNSGFTPCKRTVCYPINKNKTPQTPHTPPESLGSPLYIRV